MMNVPNSSPVHMQQWRGLPGDGFPEHLKYTDLLADANNHSRFFAPCNNLFLTVLKGRLGGTKFLLNRGVTVNGNNNYGYNVLIAALHIDDHKKRHKMFRLLVKRGADTMYKDAFHQRSVLHWACILGRLEQVELLLQELAGEFNLHDKDVDGYTVLHHAVMNGHSDIVRMLVEFHRKFGVSVDLAGDKLGLTPYLHAKRLGHRQIADYLRTVGLASVGHGDTMFRSPREWSQIGKFERQKAAEMNTLEAINHAKILGRISQAKSLENEKSVLLRTGPRSLQLWDHGLSESAQKLPDYTYKRTSRSLPSLSYDLLPFTGVSRPLSAGYAPRHDPKDKRRIHGSHLKVTFVDKDAQKDEENGKPLHQFTNDNRSLIDPNLVAKEGIDQEEDSIHPAKNLGSTAFNVLGMNEKGRHAQGFRQSQTDCSQSSEYKHILGSLNTFMDILSQQQCKSFRQSVRFQKPDAAKKQKTKSNVSTLAIILGRDKAGSGEKKCSKMPAKKLKGIPVKKDNSQAKIKNK